MKPRTGKAGAGMARATKKTSASKTSAPRSGKKPVKKSTTTERG
ncbi:hypothetical protein [Nocardioides eburneiflavus]|nr:hypothetical protein [Nocardioides eburneiflavus]